jgi:AraC family transcriptional regulator of arabinose operon
LDDKHIRFVMSQPEQPIPLAVESVGFNREQEPVNRPDGYPNFHWLQTASGEGSIEIEGISYALPQNHGCLLLPNVPHKYAKTASSWETYYLTFTGAQAVQTMTLLGLNRSGIYRFTPQSDLQSSVANLLQSALSSYDLTGLDHSVELYRFLTCLKKQGITDRAPSIESLLMRLNPLLAFLDRQYSNPELGMDDMAQTVGMSSRRLTSLFRQAIGLTPYQYLISLRIRKAKELLLSDRSRSVKSVGEACGFRDASHFVATFRKQEGMTPEQYRTGYSLIEK